MNKGLTLQSILTRDLPATDVKPARIRATTPSGMTLTVSRHVADDYLDAHCVAARTLAARLQWSDQLIVGATLDGYVFVIDGGARA